MYGKETEASEGQSFPTVKLMATKLHLAIVILRARSPLDSFEHEVLVLREMR